MKTKIVMSLYYTILKKKTIMARIYTTLCHVHIVWFIVKAYFIRGESFNFKIVQLILHCIQMFIIPILPQLQQSLFKCGTIIRQVLPTATYNLIPVLIEDIVIKHITKFGS